MLHTRESEEEKKCCEKCYGTRRYGANGELSCPACNPTPRVEDSIDEIVRDCTSVEPRAKSEIRGRIETLLTSRALAYQNLLVEMVWKKEFREKSPHERVDDYLKRKNGYLQAKEVIIALIKEI